MDEENKTKHYGNLEDMFKASQFLPKFSKLHNKMKDAFNGLIEITKSFERQETEYKILIKTCLIDLFGLIEADIFYYNTIDNHPPQDEKIDFIEKMKLTFDQIATTFGKEKIVNEYFRTQMQLVRKLRKKRNNQVHPKEVEHLYNPTKRDLNDIIFCFKKYDQLINGIMNNFFFSTNIPSSFFLNR
ncbi:hypothetical protein [Pedobacter sp. UBA5917]|jgi:hypothetical protein|uniref:hypothetical protein n=1 Tax=Pedobacter sp. UBA5917 TaxID=1947061 RepID=UPI0025EC1A3C|nr:hypothetical protein [Pedobacter sp. UBA5917]